MPNPENHSVDTSLTYLLLWYVHLYSTCTYTIGMNVDLYVQYHSMQQYTVERKNATTL